MGRPRQRALVGVVAVYNLVAGLSMAYVVQRSYGDAPRRSQLRALGARIDGMVLRYPSGPPATSARSPRATRGRVRGS